MSSSCARRSAASRMRADLALPRSTAVTVVRVTPSWSARRLSSPRFLSRDLRIFARLIVQLTIH